MALVAHHCRPDIRSGRYASTRSRVLVVAATLGSLMAAALLGPASASAAYELTLAQGYTSSAITCHQMGQSDQNGVLYTTCGARIYRYDRLGTRLADIVVPAGIAQPRDVAPSPDGEFLYVSQGTATPRRLNRQANGTYAVDATWRLAQFTYWNVPWTPVGHAIATDGRGDVYISNGSLWTAGASQQSVAKYAPDGRFVTAFGDYGKEDGNWITNQDIAVSRDGRRVYVGENCGKACTWGDPLYTGSRVTRYDFTAGGTYRFTRIVSAQGPMDGNPFPRCTSAGATHSAYAVALDVKERLYVTSTTCGRIQMWDTFDDPARDRFLRSVAVNVDPNLNGEQVGRRNHYLAVDWAGRLYAQEWNLKIVPTDVSVPNLPLPVLAPLPTPDVQAPTLVSLTMPPTTTTQSVEAAIVATDDYGVAELQLAREDGNWGPWQPYSALVSYGLSDGYGIKGVYVRVRDMAGNESSAVYRTVSFVEPVGNNEPPPPVADAADPVLTAIAVPALTATRTVQVSIDATDDTGVRDVRLANEDGNWAAWQPFTAVVVWQLSAGQGAKVVYAQVRDGAGRESGVLTARTRVAADAPPPPPPGGGGGQPDTVAPLLESLTLPAETTTQTLDAVTVATDAVGVAQVRFANEDGTWTAWRVWTPTVRWTLSAGFGGKLVYAQVRDAVGNESAVVTARTSHVRTAAGPVDGADPALVAVVLPETTRTPNVTVNLTATDDIAVTQVRFANEDGVWQNWQPFGAEVPHVLTAGNTFKVVYAQVRDAVGRESNVLFARTLAAP